MWWRLGCKRGYPSWNWLGRKTKSEPWSRQRQTTRVSSSNRSTLTSSLTQNPQRLTNSSAFLSELPPVTRNRAINHSKFWRQKKNSCGRAPFALMNPRSLCSRVEREDLGELSSQTSQESKIKSSKEKTLSVVVTDSWATQIASLTWRKILRSPSRR